MSMSTAGALAPYRVLDITTADGWLCGRMLADLGADVIKVEPPGGDQGRWSGPFAGDRVDDPEASLGWWFGNRGKRSVVIDLDDPAGRARFDALAADADVLIESFGPGGMAERGLGIESLRRANPRLVVTSISPFGSDGPYAGFRGPDLVVAALSGLVWLSGDIDRAPVRVSVPQSLRHAAAEAAVHTLVALQHVARTGGGQHVDVAALPAMVRTLMNATEFLALEGRELTRMGSRVAYSANRPRHIYACADGHVTFMAPFGALGGPGLQALLEWAREDGIDVPDLLAEADVYDAGSWTAVEAAGLTEKMIDAIETTAEAVFASRTKADLYDTAIERVLLLAPVATTTDLFHDRQLEARRYWHQVEVPGHGPVTFPGAWARLSATALSENGVAPTIDQHGDAGWAAAGTRPAGGGRDVAPAGPDPFSGLKVWDMSWVGVGPLTGRYLADYGATVVRMDNTVRADVLRVNPPFAAGIFGINRSQFYADFNASKLGIGLDLAQPAARDVARRLAAWADVVVESFTPKTLRSLGLDYEELRLLNPGLVMLSTCMQGQTGPHRNYRGFGQLMGSLTGFYAVTGWPDRDPTMVYGAYTDFICQRFCATALIAAIDHRRRTGEGQHIDVSQFEASLHFLGPELLDHTVNGRVATRNGNRDPNMAPHGIYPCRPAGSGPAGERWLAVACENDEQWAALAAAMGRPEWATAPELATLEGRKANEDVLDSHIADWTSGQDADELFGRLQPWLAVAPVRLPSALHDDAQLRHLGYFVTLDHPVMGPMRYNGMQARLSDTPGRLRKAAPCVGEDTFTVLGEFLGYREEEITDLLVSGAVEINLD